MRRLVALLAAGALAGGCNLEPPYRRPSAPVPAAFKEAPGDEASWEKAHPADAAPRGRWWAIFKDPVLDSLEDQVRVSNQTLIAQEAAYREARAFAVEARAALFPTVSASPSYTRFRSSRNVTGSGVAASGSAGSATGSTVATSTAGASTGGSGQLFALPFEATYEVDLWGKIRNTFRASAYSAQASAADVANALLSLQSQLAQDYYQVRALDAEKQLLDSTVASYRRELGIAEDLYRNGIDSDEDVAQAQASLDGAVADDEDLETSRAQYEHALAILIGKAPADFSLKPASFPPAPVRVPSSVPSHLLERRPDIAAAERQVASANAQIGVARAAYYPEIDLSVTAGLESSNLSKWLTWPSRFWSLGPTVSDTLLDFGVRQGQNEEARAAYDAAVATYRQTVLTAFQGVEDNLAALRVLGVEVEQRRIASRSAKRYLGLSQNRFQAGIDSYLNVSTAETAYLTDQDSYVQTELREVTASISLVVALGGGWDESQLPGATSLPAQLKE